MDDCFVISRECKRLVEVDFPIAEVSKYAPRDNSRRTGHPSKLHRWWAPRPPASCRTVLLGLLLPDPGDPHCPEVFKAGARRLLPRVVGKVGAGDNNLRAKLLAFIGHLANWDIAAKPAWIEVSRGLVEVAYGDRAPLVVDPFAGGGAIPLEALRLGCEVFASDLNSVACLILRTKLESIPRHGPGLADELRQVGADIGRMAAQELADLYPRDPDGENSTAYLWARGVRCEAPRCGAEIPLMRSFWLCKQSKRKVALRQHVRRPVGSPPFVEFEVFEPTGVGEVPRATVTRGNATCLCCGTVLPKTRVQSQLAAQKGGADVVFDDAGRRTGGARMTAVVTLRAGLDGTARHYRLPNDADYAAVYRSQARLADILGKWERDGKHGLCPVPDEPTPKGGGKGAGRAFSVWPYGMHQWGDLFTARQKVVLITLAHHIRTNRGSTSLRELLACALGIFARCCNSNARAHPRDSSIAAAFGMQTLPITWSFPETVVSGGRAEHFDGALSTVAKVVERFPLCSAGQVQLADAGDHPLPDETADVWFTDPPYYDAIPYAGLSDFFMVWLKRALPHHPLLRDPFDPANELTPKEREVVQDETEKDNGRPKDGRWFEETMAKAFAEGRRVLVEDGIGSVIFAHKTTEGWEALLSGMIRGGWTITGSWPIATETASRLRARESAALATSVHLICRPRPDDASIGDWADVLGELPVRVRGWIEHMQGEGIRGADLIFACIGPALEIFSRYRVVETADGHEVRLAEYLEKVWEVVGRTALQRVLGTAEARAGNGLTGGLEEDARLTALFLWTLQSTETRDGDSREEEKDETMIGKRAAKGFSLPFDVVRRLAQPMGIDLDRLTGRIISQRKGIVRLLPVVERAKALFGRKEVSVIAEPMERDSRFLPQLARFPKQETRRRLQLPETEPGIAEKNVADTGGTVLDRVHSAMLLQHAGRSQALRTWTKAEQEKGQEFLRLANALSALYPRGSHEKRLLDAMLLTVPR